jgi:hypothetical protein
MTILKFGTDPKHLARRTSPSTSKEAAESVDTTRLEGMVYSAIFDYGSSGCISDELLDEFSHYPYSSITARFSALERKGYITCGPDTRTGKSGRQQRVMRVVPRDKVA